MCGEILDSIEPLKTFAGDNGPGRHHVDEITRDPFSSGRTSRRWGVVIGHADGTVTTDPDPWPKP